MSTVCLALGPMKAGDLFMTKNGEIRGFSMGEFMGKRLGTKTLFLPVKSVQLKQHCVSFFF